MNLFKKKQYVSLTLPTTVADAAPAVPDGVWIKCGHCQKIVHIKETGRHRVCPACGGLFRLSADERLSLTIDEGSFIERDAGLASKNPMSYPDYEAKIAATQKKTGLKDAVVTGDCSILGHKAVICVMDSSFIMASMGSVVGEKITRAFEYATERRLPVVIFAASGGARMQEGIVSLMQMAKTAAAAKRHSDAGLLYISALTDPTTGGVTASFAMLGDIIIAEPKATIGFAGRRVIEQTIRQKLPDEFQTAEFVMEHGFIDMIVPRAEMRDVIGRLLSLHTGGGGSV